ncbi:TPA: hypothetical protein QFG09_000028 [Enterococcus faecium]
MRLLYYNIFVCKNGEKTDYPIEKIIDFIATRDAKVKLRNLRNGDYSLTQMREPIQEKETRNRSFWISRYRDKKPLAGTRGTDEAEPIEKDVLETSNCLIIPSKNFLAMEYSHLGCRAKSLEQYINKFLLNNINDDSDKWTVEIIEIRKKSSINDIQSSSNIKSITVEFVVTENTEYLLSSNEIKNDDSVIRTVINSSNETAKIMHGNIACFSIKKGKIKKQMDPFKVVKILKTLNWDAEEIQTIKVIFDNPRTGKKNDSVDLKHDRQLQDEILIGDNSNGFEYLAREISDFYYGDGNRKGLSSSNQYNKIAVNSTTKIVREILDEKKAEGNGEPMYINN